MFYTTLSFIFNLFSAFNISFCFEMILSVLIVFMVYLQKNSEEFSTQTKLSAPSSRSNFQIKFTYTLIFLFVFNTCLLNIFYQKEYKNYIVSDEAGEKIKSSKIA